MSTEGADLCAHAAYEKDSVTAAMLSTATIGRIRIHVVDDYPLLCVDLQAMFKCS